MVSSLTTVKTRVLLTAVLAGLVLFAASCGGASTPQDADAAVLPIVSLRGVDNKGAGLDTGARAPDFALEHADGSRSTLSELKGQPVVVNFWATWCSPCRAEMPELVDTYEKYKDQGIVIIGVNEQESEAKAMQFMDEFDITFPVVLDSRGDLANLYVARGLPTTYFIDRDGNVVEQWRGILTADLLEERVTSLLEQ